MEFMEIMKKFQSSKFELDASWYMKIYYLQSKGPL